MVQAALQSSPPVARAEMARALSLAGERVHRASESGADSTIEQQLDATDPFLAHLRPLMAPGFDLSLRRSAGTPDRPRLRAAFAVDQERWVIEFPEPHGSPREPLWSLLVALVFVGLVPFFALIAGIRLITRPMARLAREVAERSDRLRPLDLHRGAGLELQEIALAFNGLVSAVLSAHEARRNMLAGVSHDLRAPLARLRLRAQIECQARTARALETDCLALERIIGQFLAYAQGEAGVSLGVAEPLAELARYIGSSYADRGVRVEIDDEIAARVAYPDLAIWRIVTNLVDNAIDHGLPPVVLHIAVDACDCRITVHDGGAGIAPDQVEQALKPFVKLRKPAGGRDAELGHCGLGLAIVGQICQELGGRVLCATADGVGSAVGVVLPLPSQVTEPPSPATAS
jgi:two-component system osmolarity sensor histidine kinase EnvZ